MTAADLGAQLGELVAERRVAISVGLGENATFMEQLEGEIAAVHASYVGLAVTEIASLRAALGDARYG